MTTTDLPAEIATEPPFAILTTPIGTVKIQANGTEGATIRLCNHPQYDRTTERYGNEPNGVTDLVVRNIGYTVSIWVKVDFEGDSARVTIDFDNRRPSNYKRTDSFLVHASDAAARKMTEVLSIAVAQFMDTEEGKAFYKAGRVHALANRAVNKQADAEEAARKAHDAEVEAAAALAAWRTEVAS